MYPVLNDLVILTEVVADELNIWDVGAVVEVSDEDDGWPIGVQFPHEDEVLYFDPSELIAL